MKLWIKDTVERVVATAAEATLAVIVADQVSSAFALDWKAVAGVAGLAGLTTVLKTLAALKVSNTVSPASLATAKE